MHFKPNFVSGGSSSIDGLQSVASSSVASASVSSSPQNVYDFEEEASLSLSELFTESKQCIPFQIVAGARKRNDTSEITMKSTYGDSNTSLSIDDIFGDRIKHKDESSSSRSHLKSRSQLYVRQVPRISPPSSRSRLLDSTNNNTAPKSPPRSLPGRRTRDEKISFPLRSIDGRLIPIRQKDIDAWIGGGTKRSNHTSYRGNIESSQHGKDVPVNTTCSHYDIALKWINENKHNTHDHSKSYVMDKSQSLDKPYLKQSATSVSGNIGKIALSSSDPNGCFIERREDLGGSRKLSRPARGFQREESGHSSAPCIMRRGSVWFDINEDGEVEAEPVL